MCLECMLSFCFVFSEFGGASEHQPTYTHAHTHKSKAGELNVLEEKSNHFYTPYDTNCLCSIFLTISRLNLGAQCNAMISAHFLIIVNSSGTK